MRLLSTTLDKTASVVTMACEMKSTLPYLVALLYVGLFEGCLGSRSLACPEEDVDFAGHTFASASNVRIYKDCGNMCKSQIRNCSYWTWESHTKMCYFKSSDSGYR